MRLAVYTDYVYRRVDGVVYAERAFALFLAALSAHVERLRLIGRLAPDGGQTRYALPGELELAGLPHYDSLANPAQALRSLLGSIRRMWTALDDVDVVWILGPYPHAVLLTLVALARRKPVVIGVRQDWPSYVRMRRPGRRWMHLSADLLEGIWRTLARRLPVVAVGSELSAKYAHAPAMLDLVVSMVPAAEVERPVRPRDYGSERQILSVGRLDEEKNPLLLAEVLALLGREDGGWRLRVCGEGDLAGALAARLASLGLQERAELLGYVPMERSCSSSTDRVTSCSTRPGRRAFRRCSPRPSRVACRSSPPTSAASVAASRRPPCSFRPATRGPRPTPFSRIARDGDLRARLTEAGRRRARDLTLEAQTARLAAFLLEAAR